MSKFERARGGKPKAKRREEPWPAMPLKPYIKVIQCQYFDNGEKTKQGQSRYTLKLEVYCEDKFEILNPFWVRTASLLDPQTVLDWATKKHKEGELSEQHLATYQDAYNSAETFMQSPDAEFVRIGHIEDRRFKKRYPGQYVLVTKVQGYEMRAYVSDGEDGYMVSDPFQFDKVWTPGSKRRLFYGWYDPHGIYYKTKEWAEKQAAYLAVENKSAEPVANIFSDYGNLPF